MAHLHFGAAVPVVFRLFPSVCGHSLSQPRTSLLLPDHLPGTLKLILLSFNRRTFEELKSWSSTLHSLQTQFAEKHPQSPEALQTYQVVLRSRAARPFGWFLEERWRLLLFPDLPAGSPSLSSPLSTGPASGCCPQRLSHRLPSRAAPSLPPSSPPWSGPRTRPPTPLETDEQRLPLAETKETGETGEAEREAEYRRLLSSTFFAYVDRRAFLAKACLPDCQRPYLFLVDEKNRIQWCEHERFSEEKAFAAEEIRQLLGLGETVDARAIEAAKRDSETALEARSVPLLTSREDAKS
ncbi:hypothetical protein TGCAST_252480 [Toxoplasma gondii CAST]|uniref:Thioredoxin-like protein n=1 Tax=Toxoplasma gondii CAST TaxID=943122 RepID=A0A3R7YIP1_TOXGO|nr:hypothetical protein TGCAST_252480 [Toxoplasma gondii CAST]